LEADKAQAEEQVWGRATKKALRGERLVTAARKELAQMVSLSPKTDPINVSTLAARLRVTRKSIYNNNLKTVIREHAELQSRRFSDGLQNATTSERRPLEERIHTLEKENEQLRRKLDGWIERWAAVEYHARINGINADLLFAPIPLPQRNVLPYRAKK
jgi:hypothetical protein